MLERSLVLLKPDCVERLMGQYQFQAKGLVSWP